MARPASLLRLTVLPALLLAAPAVRAQPSGQDVATAQALFDEGKRLMAAGKHAEACPKLIESQRIDPGGGTLYAIALCHEGEGKTATAWADYTLALSEARKDHRADREAAAQERIKALEPKLTRFKVVPAVKVAGLEIQRDGTKLGDAQWGTALPIDPGEHTFDARAPGKQAWHKVIDVRGEGSTVEVSVPELASEAVTAPPPAPAPAPVSPPPARPAEDGGSSQRTWALVAGGVGLVATGVGLGFGLSAQSKWNTVEESGRCNGNQCTGPGDVIERGKDAGTQADIATVLVTVGVVGLAAGLVLWLTAPSGERTARGKRDETGRIPVRTALAF